jgi:hypothetical protein
MVMVSGRNFGLIPLGSGKVPLELPKWGPESSAPGEAEHGGERLVGRIVNLLVSQHRRILGHVVAKRGAKSSQIVRPAIARAHYSLLVDLVSQADSRRKSSCQFMV